jgi:SAM-dependent methyltransferase
MATGTSDQTACWNGAAGQAWVQSQAVMDELYRPFEEILVNGIPAGGRILDVGCGTGSTTVAAARRLGARGVCVGVDVSEPMVAAARARAERDGSPAEFVCADAQEYPFEPAGFDAVISRFGVMFFPDPGRAFANLRRAARGGAGLRLIVWRGPGENPFMTTAERAAAPLLPALPARDPDAPGQFGLARRERITDLLDASGWAGVDVEPLDVACVLPEAELAEHYTRFGPLGQVLPHTDEATRASVLDVVGRAFDPYRHGAQVRFTAACWLITATAATAGS